MFDRLKSLLAAPDDESAGGTHSVDALQLATACLLVEAAHQDDAFDVSERALVDRLVRDRFGLDAAESDALIAAADREIADSVELSGFIRRIKDSFDHGERIGMIEMLWEVVYSDGDLHDLEANLLRRVAALLYVSDRESGDARKRVLQKGRRVG